jgi:hypothetical protein
VSCVAGIPTGNPPAAAVEVKIGCPFQGERFVGEVSFSRAAAIA